MNALDSFFRFFKREPSYWSSYRRPNPLFDQVRVLKKVFPQLDDSYISNLIERYTKLVPTGEDGPFRGSLQCELTLPEGAEGWFAIPKWSALGRTLKDARDTVRGAIKMRETRTAKQGSLVVSEKTSTGFKRIYEEQPGDIIIFPAQFGLRHHETTFCRVREQLTENEFGLDTFTVACMLLTHPERLAGDMVSCPGEHYLIPREKAYGFVKGSLWSVIEIGDPTPRSEYSHCSRSWKLINSHIPRAHYKQTALWHRPFCKIRSATGFLPT